MKVAPAPPDDARDRVLDFEATPLDPYLHTFAAHALPPGAVKPREEAPYRIEIVLAESQTVPLSQFREMLTVEVQQEDRNS